MVTTTSPALPASGRSRPISLYGIRIALALALVAASVGNYYLFSADSWVKQHRGQPGPEASGVPDPLWMVLVWAATPLVPYFLSFILLSTRKRLPVVLGAGVAAGLFSCFVMAAPSLGMGLLLGFGLAQAPYFLQAAASLLVFLLFSLWVVVSAFLIGKMKWGTFATAAAVTWLCVVQVFSYLRGAEARLDRRHEQQKVQAAIERMKPLGDAQQTLISLTGCLLLNHSVHPEYGFPSSLAAPPANWACETKFAADASAGYTLSYTPKTDPASGRVTDFQLVAVPQQSGAPGIYPLMVDSRGIVFSDATWPNVPPFVKALNGERRFSQIDSLQRNIQHYLKDHGLTEAPLSLSAEIVGSDFGFQVPSIAEDGLHLEARNFATEYFPPRAGDPSHFALSAQCQSYGQNCLRSYFLDYDGVLHATGEPRQATAGDPPALDCENSDYLCQGVARFLE